MMTLLHDLSIPCATGLSDRVVTIEEIESALASVTYDESDTPVLSWDTESHTPALFSSVDSLPYDYAGWERTDLVTLARSRGVTGISARWSVARIIQRIQATLPMVG